MDLQTAQNSAQEETALILLSPMPEKRQPRPSIERTPETLPIARKNRKMPESFKERLGISEFSDKSGKIYKAIFAEFLGTVILNLFGCGSCVTFAQGFADTTRIALAFGMAIMVGVQSFAHVSGAHLNPAVTFGFLITGRVPILRGILYIIIQCVGCLVGSLILKGLTDDKNLGTPAVHPELSAVQGMGFEFFNGFALVMVVFAVCDPHRALIFIVAPLVVGFTIVMGHVTTVPFTGAAMNPARAFGSAVAANKWDDHWIYWVGPILGGAVAALIYQFVFAAPRDSEYSQVGMDDKAKGKDGA